MSKYLSLYPDDFSDETWIYICNHANVSTMSYEIRIYITDQTIVSMCRDEHGRLSDNFPEPLIGGDDYEHHD